MHGIFDARVSDLIAERLVGVICLECNHCTDIPAMLIKAQVPGTVLVSDLPRRSFCRHCGTRGRAQLIVGYALGFSDTMVSVYPEDERAPQGASAINRKPPVAGREKTVSSALPSAHW